jgi:hypothetical protein
MAMSLMTGCKPNRKSCRSYFQIRILKIDDGGTWIGPTPSCFKSIPANGGLKAKTFNRKQVKRRNHWTSD